MKRIAAITMVRNDDFFLEKWVEYYGREFGKENLYIYFDGLDQQIPSFCDGTHSEAVEKIGSHVISAEKRRLKFLSEEAAGLLSDGYDAVVGVDADEYIVVDPATGLSLTEYILKHNNGRSLSALGLDFGQKIGEEGDLNLQWPFLRQRKYAQIGTRYTKPSVLYHPAVWGSGFHRIKGENFIIGKDLYLMHFGYSDLGIIQSRINNIDRVAQGWLKHVVRRLKTIEYVNSKKVYAFEKAVKVARICETILRPPFAWNKPALLWQKIIVKIPERFEVQL